MAAVTGIIVDVSGSMERSARTSSNERGGEWARSVFKVIDDLIEHDVSSENQMFAIGMGATIGHPTFDIIRTVEQCNKKTKQNSDDNWKNMQTIGTILESVFGILERNGARYIRKWATETIILSVVSQKDMLAIHEYLESDSNFLHEFVHNYLPPACRDWDSGATADNRGNWSMFSYVQDLSSSFITCFKQATPDDIQTVLGKVRSYVKKAEIQKIAKNIKEVNNNSLVSVETASEVIHGCHGGKKEKVTETRINELMEAVKPFIYGKKSLIESLNKATELLSLSKFDNHTKLLFILSDGYPSDNDAVKLDRIIDTLKRKNIYVVSCYVTDSLEIQPKRLYCKAENNWEYGAHFLFKLSSTLETQQLPRTIFIQRDWKVDTKNNETKLFLQVNHPDHIRDVCKLARDVVCNQDSLSDILASVDLEMYMYQSLHELKVKKQEEKTCYANASATVIHLSMKRILGRRDGYSEFEEIREDMIDRYGKQGANTLAVLKEMCPKYRLRCRKVNILGAMEAVSAKRPVVAQFALTDNGWRSFNYFYLRNAKGILTEMVFDFLKLIFEILQIFGIFGLANGEKKGHAVVFTSYDSESLRFMNSWGTEWAHMGFFRVANTKVLNMEFFEVFWKEEDLNEDEKEYFEKHGGTIADKLMKQLKGLKHAEYQCPLCSRSSLVSTFSGTLKKAKCSKCGGEFESDETGNILALNIYLTSLCT